MTSISHSEQSEGIYVTDVIIPLLSSLGGGTICLSTTEYQSSKQSKAKYKINDGIKLWRETLNRMNFIGASCRPAENQFGVIGLQIVGTDLRLNILVKDLSGITRYFHLDHSEIPLTSHTSHTKSLVRLLLTLRNIMIINKSLLVQALEQANTHPSRNVDPNPIVSSPPYNKY
ncbi:hypothetical protein Glove_129g6 [Diversispora epigaea]|uniref:Uncharacterized protein n=1 Tax=Diversispora epigaea TaxID=1348612 RepID=A0A397J741_9GLOM|nr:hypothetical protein Glove_129g6 [Diversispora epigaea]